ncbi:hypothetical protein EV368DRAFT_70490, partial [Lentinula lateritia]
AVSIGNSSYQSAGKIFESRWYRELSLVIHENSRFPVNQTQFEGKFSLVLQNVQQPNYHHNHYSYRRPFRVPSPNSHNASLEDEDLDEDEEEIIRKAKEKVRRMKERKAAAAAAAKQKAKEEAARKAVEEERAQAAAKEERRRRMAEAATARSRRGSSPEETLGSPRRPVVEIRREKGKGKGKSKAQPVDEDPDDGGDGDDDDDEEDERAPCERCRSKKIPCQMQAGKRSSIICKPCHDAKVRCSYSNRPFTVKREGGSNPTGERIAVMESQMAQGLADLRALRETNSKSQQYLRQLLRRQEDDHARLISMETRMAMMGMGEEPT